MLMIEFEYILYIYNIIHIHYFLNNNVIVMFSYHVILLHCKELS